MTSWQNEWKQLYSANPQSLEPFFLYLRYIKGLSQIEIQQWDIEDDEHFKLLEQYGNDPTIERLSEECQKEIGI